MPLTCREGNQMTCTRSTRNPRPLCVQACVQPARPPMTNQPAVQVCGTGQTAGTPLAELTSGKACQRPQLRAELQVKAASAADTLHKSVWRLLLQQERAEGWERVYRYNQSCSRLFQATAACTAELPSRGAQAKLDLGINNKREAGWLACIATSVSRISKRTGGASVRSMPSTCCRHATAWSGEASSCV